MLLRHFLADLERLRPRLTDWDEVNVDGVRLGTHGLEVTIDETDTESSLEQAKQTITELEATIKEMEQADKDVDAVNASLEAEVAALREEMAALKDPTEDGATVLTYRERTQEAEKSAEQWRGYMRDADQRVKEMGAELTAMRKRKGVEPGIMACCHEVTGFINTVAYQDGNRYDKDPQGTIERYRLDAKRLQERIAARV